MQPVGTLLPTLIAGLCVDSCKVTGKSLAIIQRLALDPCSWWCQFPNIIVWNVNSTHTHKHLFFFPSWKHVNLPSPSGARDSSDSRSFSLPGLSSSAKFISSGNLWPDAIHLLGAEWDFSFGSQVLHLVFSTCMCFLATSPAVLQVLLRGCGCLCL